MKGDKDDYLRRAEKLVEEEGFTTSDVTNLESFLQSTAGRKLLGTMAIEARNNIMRLGNVDFSLPTAVIEAQMLRGQALSLNSFIDVIFGLVEEPEESEDEVS